MNKNIIVIFCINMECMIKNSGVFIDSKKKKGNEGMLTVLLAQKKDCSV